MAVLVPIAVAAVGSAAGWAATTVAVAAIASSAIGSATGVNEKVDRAFGKVFGEDLVQFGNIAGAAFLAFGGGQWLGTPAPPAGTDAATIAATGNGADTLAAPAAPPIGTEGVTNPLDARLATGTATTPGSPLAPAPSSATTRTSPPTPGVKTPGVDDPTNTDSTFDRISKWFNDRDPRTQAAIVQVAGGVLAGGAQGYLGAKQAEEEREFQRERDSEYRSGSGGILAPAPLYKPKRRT